MSFKLIVSIVPRDFGEFVTETARSAGAGGGTIIMGKGTAQNSVLQLLGFGDAAKDITYNIVESSLEQKVRQAIVLVCSEKKAHFGVLFTINIDDFIKAGSAQQRSKINKKIDESAPTASASQKENSNQGEGDMLNYQMINVIVNKGYAEDAMAAARKAGAGGGTIIGARGTAKEDDAAFFGMKIVPEKEMLMILVPSEKKAGIVQAIEELACFKEAGSGIIFCNEAQNFTLLGAS